MPAPPLLRATAALGVCLAVWLSSAVARAETRRIAIVVGNDRGAGLRPALRYAEVDAASVAQVLTDLGGFAPGDVHLLRGHGLSSFSDALASARRRVNEWRRRPDDRVVLLFYYSGHSDGEALELGRERLGFGELRRALKEVGADVRLAIVDSCKSGALLAVKGGSPGPSFDIRITDDLASSGEALLTSSAADELALESRELGASFFSHHFVSGLRGAADVSGDGRVTLAEAYHHAFVRTLAATANTVTGPQHPAYDYRLSGQGELILTEVIRRSAVLALPDGFDRVLVEDASRARILAEVQPGSARRIAVPPGRYRVIARRQGKAYAGSAQVTSGERVVLASELVPVPWLAGTPRGDLTAQPRALWAATFGAGTGVARDLGPMSTFRLSRLPPGGGWRAGLDLTTGRGPGFRESAGSLQLGYEWASSGSNRWGAAGLLVTGAVLQSVGGEKPSWTPFVGPAPALSFWRSFAPGWALGAEVAAPLVWLKRDGALGWQPLVTAAAGVAYAL